ncbi:hypothetical protein OHC33_007026 [Knufia fluminis]|uniref:Uncharacterized protein n=1 Tax=Knufia fluminis TaxID=191047 RepID=A0AAN8EC95_9EURO|nr:hypothetical protein OHC33_007026 [Knufia fluminis]
MEILELVKKEECQRLGTDDEPRQGNYGWCFYDSSADDVDGSPVEDDKSYDSDGSVDDEDPNQGSQGAPRSAWMISFSDLLAYLG